MLHGTSSIGPDQTVKKGRPRENKRDDGEKV